MGLPPLKIDRNTGLTNIPDGIAYSICKSLMCRQCGHLFVDYRFSDAETARLYSDYRGDDYTSLRESYEPGYSDRNTAINNGISYLHQVEGFLNDFVPNSDMAILDWGGDTGINTPFLERRSLVHIFDPSAKAPLRTDTVRFSETNNEQVDYDLVVLSNVLEHVAFPSETLGLIRPYMTPKSTLYVEVPLEVLQQGAEGPPFSGAYRKKHWHEHINFFTARSMEELLARCGFSVMSHEILDITAWHETTGVSAVNLLQYACKIQD